MTCFPYIVGMGLRGGGTVASFKSPRKAGLGFLARMGDPIVGKVCLGKMLAPIAPMSFVVSFGEKKFECEITQGRLIAASGDESCEMEIGEDGDGFVIPKGRMLTLRSGDGEPIRMVAERADRRFVYFTSGTRLLRRPYGFFVASTTMDGYDARLIGIASVASVAIQSLTVLRTSWETV